MDILVGSAASFAFEIGLFAAVVFLIFGLDDLAIDLLWISGKGRQSSSLESLQDIETIRFAVAIPVWDEGEVIGAMLGAAKSRWAGADCRFYVGVYPNDLATMRSVAGQAMADRRIQLVINAADGPTTKGDCLNAIWHRIAADAASGRFVADALLVHDAEDVVDAAELKVLSAALAECDYAQLPVVPLMADDGRWIGGHYCDEFAEAHGKELPVRAALGGPLPTAGVGCAFRIAALATIASAEGPFRADCLTEDYELGVRLAGIGAVGRFVRVHHDDGTLVASRAFFPQRIDESVRQKTRWLRGIALEGWDRIGWGALAGADWRTRLTGYWMLWRDRRALLSAVAILFGYGAVVVALVLAVAQGTVPTVGGVLALLLLVNLPMLLWRLAMRALHTGHIYGWAEGARAVLRQPVSNIILVMTAWRAFRDHLRGRGGGRLVWDKTVHRFPAL